MARKKAVKKAAPRRAKSSAKATSASKPATRTVRTLDDVPIAKFNLSEMATFFGISTHTLHNWRIAGCPQPGPDGRLDLRAVCQWLVKQRKVSAVDPDDGGPSDSPWLEKKREYEAGLRKLDLEERKAQLVRVDRLREGLQEFAALLRNAGEQLGRVHGPEAQDTLAESLDDAERVLQKVFGNGEDQ